MGNITMVIGTVREVEGTYSNDSHDGLRLRVELPNDYPSKLEDIPWAFPLMPKVFQAAPKVGEAVLVFKEESPNAQRMYLGPIISQPQFNTYCATNNATTLLESKDRKPLEKISNLDDTRGSFPSQNDVAVIGRGAEDIILKYKEDTHASEVDIRAGIRGEATNTDNKNMIGNIIFNEKDPAYIQLKHKYGIATKQNNAANSVANVVANRINIMSNKDDSIAHNLGDKDSLVNESKMDDIMDNLHQVPKGDKLVELLNIMKGCILHHVHPWAGMEQCGDWSGYINRLNDYNIDSILSDYVRIS